MRTNYFFPALLSMTLLSGLSSCNKDDDKPQSSDTPDVENFERPNVVPLTFDRFEDQNVPEVTLGDADTSFLVINKSILQRFNLEVKDSSIIVVWKGYRHLPYAKQATKVEDLGDKLKVYVKYVDYSRALPDGDYSLSGAIYTNEDQLARNSDKTINSDYYVDEHNHIHPVAFSLQPSLEGSNDSGVEGDYTTNFENLPESFMVEDLVGSNIDFVKDFNDLKFNAGIKGVKLRVPLTEDNRTYMDVGIDNVNLQVMLGFACKLKIETEWVMRKKGWFSYPWPETTLHNFVFLNYGKIDLDFNAGISLNHSSTASTPTLFGGDTYKDIPPALAQQPNELNDDDDDLNLTDFFDPAMYNEDGYTVLDNQQAAVEELAGLKDEANAKKRDQLDAYRKVLKEFSGFGQWFMVGPVPVYLSVSPVLKFAVKKPVFSCSASLKYHYSNSWEYYLGVGYSKKNGVEMKYNDGKNTLKLKEGWDMYHDFYPVNGKEENYIEVSANGSIVEKVGFFFELKGELYKSIGLSAGLGTYLKATVSGKASGFKYDFTKDKDAATFPRDCKVTTTGELDIAASVNADISAFGVKKFAEAGLEWDIAHFYLWKAMFYWKYGTVKKGYLSNGSENIPFAIGKDDHKLFNYKLIPDDLIMNSDFLLDDKIKLYTIPITVDGFQIDKFEFPAQPLVVDKATRLSKPISAEYEYSDGLGNNFTCKIYDCVIDYNKDKVKFKYSVTVNGNEHIYEFTQN